MRPTCSLMIVVASLAATTLSASAETMKFTGALSAGNEVPPHPDLKGAGTAMATYDTETKTLTYTADYSGLTGPATAAHFHGPAPAGKNAGVMVPITGSLASPIKGSVTLTAEQAAALEGGMMYFNLHTEANKGGEVRAQMMKAM